MIREWFVSVMVEAIAKAFITLMKATESSIHPLHEARVILGDYEVSIKRRVF